MHRAALQCVALSSGLLLLGACDDRPGIASPPEAAPAFATTGPPPPVPLVTASFGGSSLTFWPFTGSDFQNSSDPLNLIFVGQADPRALRAALIRLDGNRTAFGFPLVPPFDCTWSDAVGGVQTAWSTAGWSGSVIQLQCGEYGPVRFHLRLFRAGAWTLGNVHFEVLIPGTADHEVLSWELAEQLVVADFIRSGLLDAAVPVAQTAGINPAPSYRAIDPRVYNGLPAALIAAIGGPPQPAAAPIPIGTDGRATILNLARSATLLEERAEKVFTLQYAQYIPKPFCSTGPLDWVRVDGPVEVRHTVTMTASGQYEMLAQIHGRLSVTPVNILASPPAPIGETHEAEVLERYNARSNGDDERTASLQLRTLLPVGKAFGGRRQVTLTIGPGGSNDFRVDEACGG